VRIPLDDAKHFAKCPKYLSFLRGGYRQTISKRLYIIDKIIKKAYIRRTEYEKKTEWRTITNWIDKIIFKDVDVTNEESFKAARKFSENILTFIQKWYEFDYVRNDNASYVDTPVSYGFNSHVIHGCIPLIHVGEVPVISYVDEESYDNLKIYKDIKAMSWAFMLLNELSINKVKIKHISIGPGSGFKVEPVSVDKKVCTGIKKALEEIAISISAGVSYPSYTSACNTCSFKRKCYF
jgi:CRISPR/Cas system-associated exonuclease Cas4 (RecB family)